MKVEETNLAGTSAAAGRPQAPAVLRGEDTTRTNGGHGDAGDRVELSGLSGKLAAALAADAGGRTGRVESLARRVRAGNYRVPASQVSRAVLRETVSVSREASATGANGQTAPPARLPSGK